MEEGSGWPSGRLSTFPTTSAGCKEQICDTHQLEDHRNQRQIFDSDDQLLLKTGDNWRRKLIMPGRITFQSDCKLDNGQKSKYPEIWYNTSGAGFDSYECIKSNNMSERISAMDTKGNRWCCIVKVLQLILVALFLYAMYSLFSLRVPWKLTDHKTLYLPQSPNRNIRRPLAEDLDYETIENEVAGENIKPNWARALFAPYSMCVDAEESHSKIVFLIHSRPGNLIQRNNIRETWGSVQKLSNGMTVERLFIIGKLKLFDYDDDERYDDEDDDNDISNYDTQIPNREKGNEVLDNLVQGEADRHQDILIGNFIDTYKNLSIKHELALRWVTQNCPKAKFVLKADDDAFVDVYGLFAFLDRTLGTSGDESFLACDVIPGGTTPQKRGKWAVSLSQYRHEEYPQYCSGLAYVTSMDIARSLALRARTEDWLWIDDVWMTGLLTKGINVKYIYLNARYCYDLAPIDHWLENLSPQSSPPCTVAHLDTGSSSYSHVLHKLWQHSLPRE